MSLRGELATDLRLALLTGGDGDGTGPIAGGGQDSTPTGEYGTLEDRFSRAPISSPPVEGRVAAWADGALSELPFDRKPRPSTDGVVLRPRQRLSLQPTGRRPLPARSPASNPRRPVTRHFAPLLPWSLSQLASSLVAQTRARGPPSGFPPPSARRCRIN
ncbi:hypothetical protein PENCOP_c039G06299 [Penicillium coprophilum]|uniref:Uncharacterized protein n=1 Tax=Penicillium coprophilum TaxID=36646 RepID=A0A1V6U5J2_9EURO|nr:hypothetical protein PENCOP_c039G06299 [Penicillium coprophilum]